MDVEIMKEANPCIEKKIDNNKTWKENYEPKIINYIKINFRAKIFGKSMHFCNTPGCDSVIFTENEFCILHRQPIQPIKNEVTIE